MPQAGVTIRECVDTTPVFRYPAVTARYALTKEA
jgi:hypothetical protein